MSNRSARFWIAALCSLCIGCGENGIEHGMEHQPKLQPYSKSDFFADGRSVRTPVAGTVARGALQEDQLFYAGKEGGKDATVLPFPVTRALLERGRQRYDIFCAVCHDRVGTGNGMIVQRGFPRPPSFHSDRLRSASVGHLFDVMTNGYGRMYSFNDKIAPADRWAIVAYIRALQLSQNASGSDVAAAAPPGARPSGGAR